MRKAAEATSLVALILLSVFVSIAFPGLSSSAVSSAVSTWSKTFGGTGDDSAMCVIQTSDGGLATTGSTSSLGAGNSDVYLIKTDSGGNTQWSKAYGGAGYDSGYCVIQTSDGGYAIAGSTSSFGAGGSDMYLVKTDSNGNFQWSKTYGDTGSDSGYSVIQTTNGGYAVVGTMIPSGSSSWGPYGSAYFVKTDSNGNMEWNKTYSSSYGGYLGYSAIQTADGGYAISGTVVTSKYISVYFSHVVLIKTDLVGNQLWQKTFGTGDDYGGSFIQTSDGGYAIAGKTRTIDFGVNLQPIFGDFNFYLVKTDLAGNTQWSKTYGGAGDDEAHSVVQTSDGGFALAGATNSFGAGSEDAYLVKTEANGNMKWQKTYGGAGDDEAHSVVQTSDGGFALAGMTSSFGAGGYDVYVVKTDTNGNIGSSSTTSVDCSPNPASEGLPVICTATVSGSNPTGTITWSTNSSTGKFSYTTTSLSSGNSTTTYTDPSPGAVTVIASYSGDANNAPSSATGHLLVVQSDAFEFAVSTPGNLFAVNKGGTITVPVSVSLISGVSQTVSLVLAWIPTGSNQWFTTSFSKSSGTPPFTSTLTIIVSSDAPPTGTYTCQILGSLKGEVKDTTFTVAVNPYTPWIPSRDFYNFGNYGNAELNIKGGVCYGMCSTAILYFEHYILNDLDYPFFPYQNPNPLQTSDLSPGDKSLIISNFPEPLLTYGLNNVLLPIWFHQIYDPQNSAGQIPINIPPSSVNEPNQLNTLLYELAQGTPELLLLSDSNDWKHGVVVFDINKLSDGSYKMSISDPNKSTFETAFAFYNPKTDIFSYDSYNRFYVVTPGIITKSWITSQFDPSVLSKNGWLLSMPNYYVILADKSVTVKSQNFLSLEASSSDYFTALGNSMTFVDGIPGSFGIEEGNMQLYAIPEKYHPIVDPITSQSSILITCVDNETGQAVGYGYLLNAITTEGSLDFTVSPSSSGLLISAGTNGLNANITFFSATEQNYSNCQTSNVLIGALQTANLTVTNWQALNTTEVAVIVNSPTPSPTKAPTSTPSPTPTTSPTSNPTATPSPSPSPNPTTAPTPTSTATSLPTSITTATPTATPSTIPTSPSPSPTQNVSPMPSPLSKTTETPLYLYAVAVIIILSISAAIALIIKKKR